MVLLNEGRAANGAAARGEGGNARGVGGMGRAGAGGQEAGRVHGGPGGLQGEFWRF